MLMNTDKVFGENNTVKTILQKLYYRYRFHAWQSRAC